MNGRTQNLSIERLELDEEYISLSDYAKIFSFRYTSMATSLKPNMTASLKSRRKLEKDFIRRNKLHADLLWVNDIVAL